MLDITILGAYQGNDAVGEVSTTFSNFDIEEVWTGDIGGGGLSGSFQGSLGQPSFPFATYEGWFETSR